MGSIPVRLAELNFAIRQTLTFVAIYATKKALAEAKAFDC